MNTIILRVTNECNLRCTYCMPKEGVKKINRKAKNRVGGGIRGMSFFANNWKEYGGWKQKKLVVED